MCRFSAYSQTDCASWYLTCGGQRLVCRKPNRRREANAEVAVNSSLMFCYANQAASLYLANSLHPLDEMLEYMIVK